ncbi:hypothetical protein [Micromonospora sp. RL09-050-HVF-A]|uniref:hypothetical protein n=1 Tax=Micromonospora sp. RL09-050-HVF-A TaxID=1703433 RepID=UPI001C5F267B|nr:hypothetical protein [Micromonospora sp. RL09-050-HVF-A]MBW4703634.1 hypothetical protein [Micromonospora sp. RL09-050-HVF-A]
MQPPAGSQVSRVPAQRTPPDQSAPPAPLPVPPRRPRRLRTVLTVVGGVLALLCVGAGVTGYVLYERAATPDRSAPDVVVDNYLREFLVNENDTRAELLVCEGNPDGLAELRTLRDDLRDRERRFATTLTVSWGALLIKREGESAQVETDLILSAAVDGISQTDRQRWRFQTRLKDHWRVCEATKRI